MVGEHFDAWNDQPSYSSRPSSRANQYLGVHFACCSVYSRVYVNRAGTHYIGYCPRCARRVAFRIDSDGTDDRFFTAY